MIYMRRGGQSTINLFLFSVLYLLLALISVYILTFDLKGIL